MFWRLGLTEEFSSQVCYELKTILKEKSITVQQKLKGKIENAHIPKVASNEAAEE